MYGPQAGLRESHSHRIETRYGFRPCVFRSGVLPTAHAVEGSKGDLGALHGAASPVRPSPKTVWLTVLGGILAVVIAAVIFWLMRPLAPPRITGFTQLTNDGRQKPNTVTSNGVLLPIISDGSRLYFWEFGPGMSQVSASGGTSIPVSGCKIPFLSTFHQQVRNCWSAASVKTITNRFCGSCHCRPDHRVV